MRRLMMAAMLATTIGGCEHNQRVAGAPVAGGRMAVALLTTGTGMAAGRATATEVAGGVRVTADVRGLAPGLHGIHVHAVGRCDRPDFVSAGGHWNPAGTRHGTLNPQGPHAGDMPNLLVGADGRGTLGVVLAGATLDAMLDADGAALVVHAAADDLQTDPSGNSGARLACGVFAPA